MSIQQNLRAVRRQLPEHVQLIAVSKTHPPEVVQEAYDAGHRVFGENRVQELTAKYEVLPKDIEWHLIGHLQSNKVKHIAPFVHLIHSVDSLKLLEEINRQGRRHNRVLHCLLQVHIAREETKFGFSAAEVEELVTTAPWDTWEHVAVVGLMGMATFTENREQVRREFRGLKNLLDDLRAKPLPPSVAMRELSIGMSGDFEVAIEEGSTMVRVGTAVFGKRS